MKKDEFLGIGRTWFTIDVLLLLTAAMVFTDDLRIEQFIEFAKWALGFGTAKSMTEIGANFFGKKKEKSESEVTG